MDGILSDEGGPPSVYSVSGVDGILDEGATAVTGRWCERVVICRIGIKSFDQMPAKQATSHSH